MKTLAKAVHKSSFPAAVKQQADRSGALFQRKAANETEALSKIISSHNPVNSCSPSLSPNSGSKAAQLSTFIQRSGIQPELTIGQGGEKYEEVDSVAEGVMTMPEPPVKGQVEKPVQAKEADGKKSPPVPAAHSDIHSLPGARTKERTQMPYVQRRKGPVPAKCAKPLRAMLHFIWMPGGSEAALLA
ncbi:MAG: hypothetical protein OEV42_19690 [Deltaproteobacteria bacterium]|nr:hypothetical protein [Deltaproteobacteria bacterium]